MMPEMLKPHGLWLSLLLAGLLLLFVVSPLAQYAARTAGQDAKEIAAERDRLRQALDRYDDDMRLARKLDGAMSAEAVARLLAPVDRLRVAAELERQANARRFSHFTYTLSPEKAAQSAVGAGGLSESELTLAADMPLDTDAAAFIAGLNGFLPGRVRLRQLSLTRIDAPLSLANIHMEASVEWLSNGAAEERKGGL